MQDNQSLSDRQYYCGIINDLKSDLSAARAALKPFADCCEQIADTDSDEEWAKFRLLIKNYRLARATIARLDGRSTER